MIEPTIASLNDKADSRYTLVIMASKRARQLSAGAKPTLECDSNKVVTIALNEIKEGNISYVRKKNGTK
ncbi:MAG: DNA-directed RNA polymerase subunit omega [Eubacteriales bacterium]|nr:DNA-directed RNA polymerase subunit omega [Eubacteriales bacterium]